MYGLPAQESAGCANSSVSVLACVSKPLQRRQRGDGDGNRKQSDRGKERPNRGNDPFGGGTDDGNGFPNVDERYVRAGKFENPRFEGFGIGNGGRDEIRRRNLREFAFRDAEVEKRTDSFPIAFPHVDGTKVEFPS